MLADQLILLYSHDVSHKNANAYLHVSSHIGKSQKAKRKPGIFLGRDKINIASEMAKC